MIISNGYRVTGGAIFLDRYTAPATGAANVIASAASANVGEGNSLTINISGNNIIDGTYYWSINSNSATNIGVANITDFTEYAGSFNIVNNSGSFAITPTADIKTEGNEIVSISIRSGSTTGTVLATATSTINDTSIAVPIYGSMYFNTDYVNAYLHIPFNYTNEFSESYGFTAEFWIKFPDPTNGDRGTTRVFGVPEYNYYCVDFVNGYGAICQSTTTGSQYTTGTGSYPYQGYFATTRTGIGVVNVSSPSIDPTAWNHYALVYDYYTNGPLKLFINGYLSQYINNPTQPINHTNYVPFLISSPNFNSQYYLADFRFTTTAVYTGNFTPPTQRLKTSGNASIYSSTANVNTTFSAANTRLLLQTFSPSNNYILYDNSANNKTIYQYASGQNANTLSRFGVVYNYVLGVATPVPY
jgi:hypothetical protein